MRGPEISSMPEPHTDLDRLRERLDAERFDPRTYRVPKGILPEIEPVTYPDWYNQGAKLLVELAGERVDDETLAKIAKKIEFDLERILGREKDEDSEDWRQTGKTAPKTVERGKG